MEIFTLHVRVKRKLLSTARSRGCCIGVCKASLDFFILPFPPPLTCMALNLCFQTCHAHPTDKMGGLITEGALALRFALTFFF